MNHQRGPVTRRDILRRGVRLAGAAAAGAAAAAPAVAHAAALAADDTGDPPVVDTHQHLWDLKRFRLPWLDGAGDLKRDHLMADYLKAAEGLNAVKAVYMEVAVVEDQRDAEADFVIDLCRRAVGPTVGAVIGGSPERESFRTYIARFKGSPYVKGVRAPFGRGLAGEHFVRNLRLLGEMGLCFDLLTDPHALGAAAGVVDQCPDTRFVLDHCGNMNPIHLRANDPATPTGGESSRVRAAWERGIAMLADRKNVVCKISGLMEAGEPGGAGEPEYATAINYCLDRFGPDRVMFASNWPVVNRGGSFASWHKIVSRVTQSRSQLDRRKLFHDNAMRFYDLR